MKFAVIEYDSKSGDIWRHTKQRPNYLADPKNEIDPTSFGCYVSAMSGEHIPLTSLINSRNLAKRIYRKIIGYWPPNYSLGYLSSFDAILVVYDMYHAVELNTFIKRVAEQYPDIVRIGVPTQPFGILKDQWEIHSESKPQIQEFMKYSQRFITIVNETKKTWQKMTDTKVVYLPQPYPVDFVKKYFVKESKKDKVIFVAGVTERNNIMKGLQVAKEIQNRKPAYEIHVTDKLDTDTIQESQVVRKPFLPWREHLQYLGTTSLVINTDYTQTRGRVQVDCAATGTPSIGANSDAQRDLYPDLPADKNTSVPTLVEQAISIIDDSENFQKIVTKAHEKLDGYNYENSADRITQLIKEVK